MLNAFTIDVEEWFHVCGVPALTPDRWASLPSRVELTTMRLLDLLARHDIRATCFVLGWVAERHPALVARLREAGHEIASHGHRHQRVYELGPDGFARDLEAASGALAAVGCPDVRLFRAPEWSINDRAPWALEILARQGFTVDSSMAPLRIIGNPRYPQRPHPRATAAGPIREVPPLVTRRFGQQMPFGGGWGMRMSRPAQVLTEIERRNRDGDPVTLWVHPWEIDPDPPRVALPAGPRFAHYFRLSGFEGRLSQILAGARFGTISAMLAHDLSRSATPAAADSVA